MYVNCCEYQGSTTGSSWGISSIFGGSDHRVAAKENLTSKPFNEPIQTIEPSFSMIHLREVHFGSCKFTCWYLYLRYLFSFWLICFFSLKPPTVLRPSDTNSEQEVVEITVTKKLLRSYYDIVRKNIEDFVPKAIMHFLVLNLSLEPSVDNFVCSFLYFPGICSRSNCCTKKLRVIDIQNFLLT